ncbi:MAG TPA: DUF2760 domain-containing protein [Planctomycetaceae bacterium]|nr:DUF2760 domain-containing protein [Planctomycetaceae bacterium]
MSTAFRAFFGALFDGSTAERVDAALRRESTPTTPSPVALPPAAAPIAPPAAPKQSEAITLLATLQREARLVDFLKEDLAGYADEQIGAAVREIQRDAGKTLDRLFALKPIVTDPEGAPIEVTTGFDAGRYRLTGNIGSQGPYRGALRHHGWEATQCQLPTYTGSPGAAFTIAPAEVEVGL